MSNCKVIAIANQKGVGKTTPTFNLGVALSKLGRKVLLVDGVLITLVDERTNLAKETILTLKENCGNFLKFMIPKYQEQLRHLNLLLRRKSFLIIDKNMKVANAYYKFSLEVENDGKGKTKD